MPDCPGRDNPWPTGSAAGCFSQLHGQQSIEMKAMDEYLKDPVVVNSIQPILTWILLQTTSSRSWLRIANVGILLAWTFWVYQPGNLLSGTDYRENVLYRTLEGCVPLPLLMRTIGVLLLLHDSQHTGKNMDANMNAATATRLAADPRMIATPWQVNGVPSFPAYYATRPLARGSFIRRQAAVALWQYVLLDLVYYGFLSWTGQKAFPLRAGQLEAKHLPPGPWVASGLSMLAIALIGRLSFDIPYRVVSIVAVAGGVSTANFPPLFGSIWEAYSLKNFWGKCWHQFMRQPFTITSNAITHQILRLPRSSVVGGYLNIAIVFGLSGITHYLGARAANIPYSGAMHFFGLSGMGVLIEITAKGLFCRFFSQGKALSAWCYKVIGFIWVGLWFSLVAPWYSPEWEYLFSVGSSSSAGALTEVVGAPVACLLIGLSGVLVKGVFKTSL